LPRVYRAGHSGDGETRKFCRPGVDDDGLAVEGEFGCAAAGVCGVCVRWVVVDLAGWGDVKVRAEATGYAEAVETGNQLEYCGLVFGEGNAGDGVVGVGRVGRVDGDGLAVEGEFGCAAAGVCGVCVRWVVVDLAGWGDVKVRAEATGYAEALGACD
jgi:hypothetical protein